MKIKELREMTVEELGARRRELRQEMLNLRVQQQIGQLENPSRIMTLRREVARIETIVTERSLVAKAAWSWTQPICPDSHPMSDIETAIPTPAKTAVSKTRIGKVTSDKMNKTIVVEVERRVPHPKFKKIVRKTSTFYAHDENEQAKIGDRVLISETRPMSKLKRWNLEEVLKH